MEQLTTEELAAEAERIDKLRGKDPRTAPERICVPILAGWISAVRGEKEQTVIDQMRGGGRQQPAEHQHPDRPLSQRRLVARTAVVLDRDLAVRDAFLLTAVTDLPPWRLLRLAVDPLGDQARTDVCDTFGRGLRDADYRPPRHLIPACDALIRLQGLLPTQARAQPLAMLAMLLWWRHLPDQALGACALCLADRPDNGLARLVATAVDADVYPQQENDLTHSSLQKVEAAE
jgi:hypothetical protein